MKPLLICLFMNLLFTFPISAQPGGTWKSYVNANCINGIAVQGGRLWCATDGGVVCWDMKDGTYRQYTTLDGLLNNHIYCIATGPGGTVWAGSYRGLCRFDGVSWQVIPHEVKVPHGEVVSLAIAPDGSVWTGMHSGVSRYDGSSWTDYTQEDGLPTGYVKIILFDSSGNPWCDVVGKLCRFENGRWNAEPFVGALFALSADAQGTLWAADSNTIYRREADRWETYASLDLPDTTFIQILMPAPDGRIWGSLFRGPLFWITDSNSERYPLPDSLKTDYLLTMAVDEDGTIWTGTRHGLIRFDGVSWKHCLTDDTLPYLSVNTTKVAPDGSVWFGTDGGAARFDGKTWRRFSDRDGLDGYRVSSLAFAPSGMLWAGTDNGISSYDGSAWKNYTVEIGCDRKGSAPYYPFLAVGPDGTLWVNRYQEGLSRFDGASWTILMEKDGLPAPSVFPLTVGPDGTLWSVASRVLYSFDGIAWKSWTAADGLEIQKEARPKMLVGPDGTVWCTTEMGISRFNGARWEAWASNEALRETFIYDAAIGLDGSAWFGTENGVYRYNGVAWAHFTEADGLASNRVPAVAVDRNGSVWFGTPEGVSRFTPNPAVVREEENRPFPVILANLKFMSKKCVIDYLDVS